MSMFECGRAETLMQQRRAGLSDPERLVLEEHLQRCEKCQQSAALLEGIVALAEPDRVSLTSERRRRLITSALEEGLSSGHASDAAPAPLAVLAWAAMALLVFGLGVGAWALSQPGPAWQVASIEIPAPPVQTPPPVDRVERGSLVMSGQMISEGAELPRASRAQTSDGASLLIGHATVALDRGSDVSWDRGQDFLRVHAGRVELSLDPTIQTPFVVATERYTVHALGAQLMIDGASVRLDRGEARIVSSDGEVLETLTSGGEWSVERAQPKKVEPEATPAPSRPRASRAPLLNASKELDEARSLLAQGKSGEARSALDSLLEQKLGRGDRAEAISLLADCALIDGEPGVAAAHYETVSREFSDLGAGETALYAAARLHLRRHADDDAARLFERYVERYPSGRFVREAREHLSSLKKGQ